MLIPIRKCTKNRAKTLIYGFAKIFVYTFNEKLVLYNSSGTPVTQSKSYPYSVINSLKTIKADKYLPALTVDFK